MEGLKEALKYAVELSAPYETDINGDTYTDKKVYRVKKDLKAEPLHMETLTGLVDYLNSGADTMPEALILHVVSPTRVVLLSNLNRDRERECLAQADAMLPEFRYGEFMDSENFLIGIRSKFIQNEDAEKLLTFAGTVEAGSINTYSDDGISQSASVKQGIVGKETKLVPNPVKLRPYRTFIEVEQPESEFIFRMKNRDNSVGCALFEADGGAWEREAMKHIKEYLEYELADIKNITVIS